MDKDMLSIFQSLPGLYVILKPDAPRFTILAVSDAYIAATHTKREEIVGKEFFKVFSDRHTESQVASAANLAASWLKTLKTKKTQVLTTQKYDLQLPDGSFEERYWDATNAPFFDDKGGIAYIIHTVNDVTQAVNSTARQEQDEQEIAQLQQRHNTLFEQDFVAIAVLRGANYVIEQANPLVYRIWRRTAKQMLGKPLFEALPETQGQGLEELLSGVLETGKPFIGNELPITLRRKRGSQLDTVYFNFIYIPMRDTNNAITGITVLANDVSEQVHARTTLQESEQRFRNLADTAPMYIAMADETGNAVYFNKPWLEFTGKKMEEMQGLGWLNTLHPEDAPAFERDFKHAFGKHIPIYKQYRFRRADGEYRWMLAVGAPRFTPEGQFIGYYGTYTDFHDLKMAQLAIEESEQRFRNLADNITQLVWEADKKGKAIWYNKRWYDYTGLTLKDSRDSGRKLLQHPKHVGRVAEKFTRCIQTGEVWEDTFPLKGKNGKYRWFLGRAIPIKDKQGKIVQWFGTCTDIDDLRRATKRKSELEHTTAALKIQREQLLALNQAKDEFISLASHQLRTPATGVKQYIGMLLEGYAGKINADQRRFLQTAFDSNERQLTIVNDLLKVARVDSGKMKLKFSKVDLVPLIQEVIEEQRLKFDASNQAISLESTQPSLYASVDTALFRMAVENLIDNAHKYTFAGKSVKVRVADTDDAVEIAIQDEGTGIDKADMAKLFLKFSRIDNPLSATVGGSGLGLYWVKRVIDLHSGTITVDSKVGKGTIFTIKLPKRIS